MGKKKVSTVSQKVLKAQLKHLAHEVELVAGKSRRDTDTGHQQ